MVHIMVDINLTPPPPNQTCRLSGPLWRVLVKVSPRHPSPLSTCTQESSTPLSSGEAEAAGSDPVSASCVVHMHMISLCSLYSTNDNL